MLKCRVFQIIYKSNLPLSEGTSTSLAVSKAQASLCRNLAYGRLGLTDM